MQIVYAGDNLHEMSVFLQGGGRGGGEEKYIINLSPVEFAQRSVKVRKKKPPHRKSAPRLMQTAHAQSGQGLRS